VAHSTYISLAYASAAAPVSQIDTPVFDACSYLMVLVRIAGYSGGGGIAQLRFNGDSGTTQYAWRVSNNNAAATTAVSGVAAGIKVSQTLTTGARALAQFWIGNVNGRAHGVQYQSSDLSESAATAPDICVGSGIWTSTAQITRITLEGGGVNLLAGTDIAVFGLQGLG